MSTSVDIERIRRTFAQRDELFTSMEGMSLLERGGIRQPPEFTLHQKESLLNHVVTAAIEVGYLSDGVSPADAKRVVSEEEYRADVLRLFSIARNVFGAIVGVEERDIADVEIIAAGALHLAKREDTDSEGIDVRRAFRELQEPLRDFVRRNPYHFAVPIEERDIIRLQGTLFSS